MSLKNAAVISTKDSDNYKSVLQFLNNQLNSVNYVVTESIILDDEISLITKIQNLKDQTIFVLTNNYEFIFEVLSKAFNKKFTRSTHLTSIYNSISNISLPNSSKIFQIQNHANGINPVCINIENVFVLPDDLYVVKEIFEKSILPLFTCEQDKVIGKRFILRCAQNCDQNFVLKFSRESVYADSHSDSVRVINYCVVNNDTCEQNVIIYSSNFHTLVKCIATFKNVVPQDIIMRETTDESFLNNLLAMKNEPFVQEALQLITKCYEDYEPENVFLSFNGGKDCTVLLYLVLHVLQTKHPEYKNPLLCVYIQSNHPFPEVVKFIEECQLMYNMDVVTIKNTVKEGLKEILNERSHLQACLMGTRRTDPFAENLNHFQVCDPGWPKIMRVSPLLDWKYSDIWNFILNCKIPYCNLYNLGYTSLGSTTNTIPNPYLKSSQCCGTKTHSPAYMLQDGSKERSGRL